MSKMEETESFIESKIARNKTEVQGENMVLK